MFPITGKKTTKYDGDIKESISFRKKILANTTVSFRERVKAPGTVEGGRIRFYQGQQLSVQINPHIQHHGLRMEPLITYAENTNPFVTGENDNFIFDCVISVDTDDYIVIDVTNTDAVNNYDIAVDISIDYYGGMQRMI